MLAVGKKIAKLAQRGGCASRDLHSKQEREPMSKYPHFDFLAMSQLFSPFERMKKACL
jgi:hypothetical protein